MSSQNPETSCLFVGLNQGHNVTATKLPTRPSDSKGKTSKRSQRVKSLIGEISSWAPYEKRMIELGKTAKTDKPMLRLGRRKLGTGERCKKKAENFRPVIRGGKPAAQVAWNQ